MKNVLISAYACIPGYGSEEGNGWQYASIVSEQPCQVWCLTRSTGKPQIEQELTRTPRPNLTIVYVDVPGWMNRLYTWSFIGLYIHYLYWQWTAWQTARQLDARHPFDLVHHVSYGSLQLGSFLYKLNRPFLFGPIGGGQHAPVHLRQYFRQYWYVERLRTLVSDLLLRFNPACYETVRRAKHILVWNDDTLHMVRSLGRTTGISKAFSGVARSFMPPKSIDRAPGPVLQLIWVGRLLPRKALELTLQGLGKVDRQLPVHLTVIGDGKMGRYVSEYMEKYGLEGRVSWVGQVTHHQVKAYYRQADVFFFTSLRDTGPAQLLEAMAYSLPIVTLNLHGQAELVNPATGIRVAVDTDGEMVATKLAEAVEWMYHHPEERLAMGRQAYVFASQQIWDIKIRHIVDAHYGLTRNPQSQLATRIAGR